MLFYSCSQDGGVPSFSSYYQYCQDEYFYLREIGQALYGVTYERGECAAG